LEGLAADHASYAEGRTACRSGWRRNGREAVPQPRDLGHRSSRGAKSECRSVASECSNSMLAGSGEVARPHHRPARAHRRARRYRPRYRRQRRRPRPLVRPWSRDRLRRRQKCPKGHAARKRFRPLTPPLFLRSTPILSPHAPRLPRRVRGDAGHSRHEDFR